jgi:polysaccharide chain length determinant protein (PEP-CTERM system associated)
MFWKHRLQVLLLWLLFCGVTVRVVHRLPTLYEATATVLVDSQKIPDKFVTPTVNSEIEDRIATLTKEILTTKELDPIIKEFDLYPELRKGTSQEEVIDTMIKDIKVTAERGWTRDRPGAFTVSYQGPDPQIVARVANRIEGLFIKKNTESRQDHADKTKNFLKNQLDDAKKKLDDLEKQVSKYKLEHNGELPQQEASLGAVLSRLQFELQGNQDAINRAQQNRIMLENSINAAESSIASLVAMVEQATAPRSGGATPQGSGVGPDQPVQKGSDALQARLDMLLVRYSDDHPEVKRLRAEIAQLRDLESKASQAGQAPQSGERGFTAQGPTAGQAVGAAAADQLLRERERLAGLKAQLTLANRELEFRSAERQRILNNIKTYETKLASLPIHEQQMAALTRDYEISKDNYRTLLNNQNAAEMAAEMEANQQGEKFEDLEPARVPEIPVKPKRALLIPAGCILGLLISLATAAGRETRRGVLLGEWELPADVVVMGRVPWIEIEVDGSTSSNGRRTRGKWLPWRSQLALLTSAVILFVVCGSAAIYLGWLHF